MNCFPAIFFSNAWRRRRRRRRGLNDEAAVENVADANEGEWTNGESEDIDTKIEKKLKELRDELQQHGANQ